MARILYGLSYSPWTHRALFALDHHRLPYRYVEHLPMLGELSLRRLTKSRKPTVPLLVSSGEVTMGSGAIARVADREGAEPKLFADGAADAIAAWEARAEAILQVARARVVAGIAASRDAQKESLPPFVPAFLRGPFAFSVKQATRFVARKHGVAGDPDVRVREEVYPLLDALDAALVGGPDTCLTGTFGYADIVMATAASALAPTSEEPGVKALGPASCAVWTYAPALERYPRVYAWRDRVYARRRAPA